MINVNLIPIKAAITSITPWDDILLITIRKLARKLGN
jgi:hypothetical protein